MNIKWEDGLKLDSNLLLKSDILQSKNSDLSNILPFNLSKGIISFQLEHDSLDMGLILITKLAIYIDDKKFISFCNSYPLSLQIESSDEIATIILLYLNVNKKTIEEKGVKYSKEVLSLSTEYDHSAQQSIMITSFRLNNMHLEMLENSFPILTMDHYLMTPVFLKLQKLISNIENYNKMIFSTSQPLMSPFLKFLVLKLRREINFTECQKDSISPLSVFNLLHDIFNVLVSSNTSIQNTTPLYNYEFDKAYSKINFLIEEIEKICQQKNIRNFVQFHRQGQKYISDDFPQAFFTAKKYYLVIKKKSGIELETEFLKEIKITSISRYTKSVILSLSGLNLRKLDKSMHYNLNISLGSNDILYEIESNSEWDFILVDKSATFTAYELYDNYDFFIAFI